MNYWCRVDIYTLNTIYIVRILSLTNSLNWSRRNDSAFEKPFARSKMETFDRPFEIIFCAVFLPFKNILSQCLEKCKILNVKCIELNLKCSILANFCHLQKVDKSTGGIRCPCQHKCKRRNQTHDVDSSNSAENKNVSRGNNQNHKLVWTMLNQRTLRYLWGRLT